MSSPGSNSGASQRASEITSAMLNVPGYADDSMLFMLRYGALAKVCYDLICDSFFFSLFFCPAFGTTTFGPIFIRLSPSLLYSSPSS
jgi:hypothetical protein